MSPSYFTLFLSEMHGQKCSPLLDGECTGAATKRDRPRVP